MLLLNVHNLAFSRPKVPQQNNQGGGLALFFWMLWLSRPPLHLMEFATVCEEWKQKSTSIAQTADAFSSLHEHVEDDRKTEEATLTEEAKLARGEKATDEGKSLLVSLQ
mmetsp:Transcript_27931/g.50580  ORF Transcript_27931/g.50580 Transcript_27931/m.50580 type:complete len:109 (+) Transcript_27931:911-1237(+)